MFERIKQLCEKNNTNITALCKEITGSSGNLPTWKKGNIRSDYLTKVAERFGVSADYLLFGAEKPTASEDGQSASHDDIEVARRITGLDPERKARILGYLDSLENQDT